MQLIQYLQNLVVLKKQTWLAAMFRHVVEMLRRGKRPRFAG